MRKMSVTLAIGVLAAGCARGVVPVTPEERDALQTEAREGIARGSAEVARLDDEGWDESSCEALDAHYTSVRLPNQRSASGHDLGPDPREERVLNARVAYMRGLVAGRCGDPERARAHYEAALAIEDDFCAPRVALASQAEAAGNPARARALLQAALREDPRCGDAYVAMARVQRLHFGEREAAVANLRRALAMEADDVRTLVELAQVYWDWGREEPERLALAAVICRQAQLIDPTYAPLYDTWGLVDIARGDLTEASAKFAEARRLDPDLFEAHMNFGQLTLSQRAYADAAEAFRDARRLKPRSYDATIGLGVALRGLGETEAAEARYREAASFDDARPEAYFDLAILYQEHLAGSVEDLKHADAMLEAFVERAKAGGQHGEALQSVLRWCGQRRGCRPGRAQNIHDTLVALGERAEDARPGWTH